MLINSLWFILLEGFLRAVGKSKETHLPGGPEYLSFYIIFYLWNYIRPDYTF